LLITALVVVLAVLAALVALRPAPRRGGDLFHPVPPPRYRGHGRGRASCSPKQARRGGPIAAGHPRRCSTWSSHRHSPPPRSASGRWNTVGRGRPSLTSIAGGVLRRRARHAPQRLRHPLTPYSVPPRTAGSVGGYARRPEQPVAAGGAAIGSWATPRPSSRSCRSAAPPPPWSA